MPARPSEPVSGTLDGHSVHVTFTDSEDVALTISDPTTASDAHAVSASQIVAITASSTLLYVTHPPEDPAQNITRDGIADQARLHQLALPHIPPSLRQKYGQASIDFPAYTTHVLVSTGSGHRHAAALHAHLLGPLLSLLGIRAQVHETTSPSSIRDLARRAIKPAAVRGERQLLLLLAGDGGVVDLLETLPSPTPPGYANPLIALIPCGTGNALANSSGAADATFGLATLLRGTPTTVPTFAARFEPPAIPVASPDDTASVEPIQQTRGAVVFSWALHTAIVGDSDTAAYRAQGAARFGAAARANLFPEQGVVHLYRGTVKVQHPDSETWIAVDGEEHAYVLASLVGQLERGFTVSPDSRALDGRLWLVRIGKASGEKVMQCMMAGYQGGKHVEAEEVRYEQARAVRVTMDEADAEEDAIGGLARWRRVCVDGKIFAVPRGGTVEVSVGQEHSGLDLLHIHAD